MNKTDFLDFYNNVIKKPDLRLENKYKQGFYMIRRMERKKLYQTGIKYVSEYFLPY